MGDVDMAPHTGHDDDDDVMNYEDEALEVRENDEKPLRILTSALFGGFRANAFGALGPSMFQTILDCRSSTRPE